MVDTKIKEIEEYAKSNNVPIMESDSIKYITEFIRKNNIEKVLELGTAIGYSAIKMALAGAHITTIERDKVRLDVAKRNVKSLGLDDKINIIYGDALEVLLNESYDLILIDASKAQNEKFFKKFENNLNSSGYIITDNLKFHGLVQKPLEEIESRNVKGLVRKIRNYIEFLKENDEFTTTFIDVGDGISISRRKENYEKV